MDIEGYLRRRLEELLADVRRNAMLAVAARAWLQGAVRALEATEELDRQTGRDLLDEFDRYLQAEGFVEQISISHSASATASTHAQRTEPTPTKDEAGPPELEGVLAVGEDIQLPGELRVLLLHVTRWSTGADLTWALLGPDAALREIRVRARQIRTQPSPLPWEIDVWDDVGTRYRLDGGSAGGGANRQRVEARITPRIPEEANTLTVVLRDSSTDDEVARVTVGLDEPGPLGL